MVVNHQYKFLFIHIPKSAGTFVTRFLGTNISGCTRTNIDGDGHMSLQKAGQVIDNRFDEYYKFCVVRNPWDWYVSLYEYTKARKGHEWRLFGGNCACFKDWIMKIGNPWIEQAVVTKFKADATSTATLYRSIEGSKLDCGWLTHRYIYSGCLDWLTIFRTMDFDTFVRQHDSLFLLDALKQEDIREQFINKFSRNVNCPTEIIQAITIEPKHNVRRHRKPYTEYYDDESREFIQHRERLLISRFGYEYEK